MRVGCSGWQYKHWKGDFYPARLPQARWLDYYAARFNTVEINNSFYRLPSVQAFTSWRTRAPEGFCYAVKASRFLTHMKKLKDPEGPLDLFFERATHLAPALGPVLYQLPPNWPRNITRLRAFLERLPRGPRHTIEFRDPSWYDVEVFAALEAHGVALCLHDMGGSESPRCRTAPFIYVRFHGPSRYAGAYADADLQQWARWLGAEQRAGADVYAYFNNDIGGHAPRDAVRLRGML